MSLNSKVFITKGGGGGGWGPRAKNLSRASRDVIPALQIAPSLCQLFNKSLRIGVVPFDWKLANVVPAHKKGDQEFVENYRPISLLSLVSKVLERCVFNTIKDHIFCRINPCQHGFLPGKNCVTQLIEVFDKILGKQLDRGKQVDVIYLDMSKAFDKTFHLTLEQNGGRSCTSELCVFDFLFAVVCNSVISI